MALLKVLASLITLGLVQFAPNYNRQAVFGLAPLGYFSRGNFVYCRSYARTSQSLESAHRFLLSGHKSDKEDFFDETNEDTTNKNIAVARSKESEAGTITACNNEKIKVTTEEAAAGQTNEIPLGYGLAFAIAFMLFWPLLAAFRVIITNGSLGMGYGQILEFDADAYMALKGIFDSSASNEMSSMFQDSETLELPQLSPAEKIVGAFFGPPSPK